VWANISQRRIVIAVEIVKTATSKNEEDDDYSGLSSSMTAHIICSLDLLCSIFDGLPTAAEQHAVKFQLFPLIHATLRVKLFAQGVNFLPPVYKHFK